LPLPTHSDRNGTASSGFVRPLWHHNVLPTTHGQPIELVSAHGVRLRDSAGHEYIDGFASSGATVLGHGRLDLADAAREQMRTAAFFPAIGGFSNTPARELAERLLSLAGHPGGAVWFATSGSEAVEAAIKISLNYHLNRGAPDRRIILCCRNAFHGNTMGAAAATGSADQDPFVREAAVNFARLPATPHESRSASDEFLAVLTEAIERLNPARIAGFIAEPVPAGGVRIPHAEHWKRVRRVLSEHGILMIADEVFCGLGRAGAMLAQHRYGFNADVITVSKALTSGYFPLSACIASAAVTDAFEDMGELALRHRGTYSAHATGCAVGLRTLQIIETDGLVENGIRMGALLSEGLKELADIYPDMLGPPIGVGLMWIAPLVETAPVRGSAAARARMLQARCRENGLLTAKPGPVVGLWPPLIVSATDIDEILSKLSRSVRECRDAL